MFLANQVSNAAASSHSAAEPACESIQTNDRQELGPITMHS